MGRSGGRGHLQQKQHWRLAWEEELAVIQAEEGAGPQGWMQSKEVRRDERAPPRGRRRLTKVLSPAGMGLVSQAGYPFASPDL